MKGFFSKRPGMSLLTLMSVFIVGGILAWQTKKTSQKTLAPLSLNRKETSIPNWHAKLDLRQAEIEGHKLIQHLPGGSKVTYTLDSDLQQWAHNYMQRFELPYGAMFLYNIHTAKTIVMAGYSADKPKMDAQDLCLAPWAPAASVFKLVTTAALLENGVPSTTMVCYHGGLRGLRKHHLIDNAKLDKTCKTLTYAVAKSVNPIIAKLAIRHLDKQRLLLWSERFGFNRPLHFELTVQPSRAAIPSKTLELAKVAAGFWHTESSVLHGAMIGAVVASKGHLVYPNIVESVHFKDGRVVIPEAKVPERVISRRTARELAQMMVKTTTIGTGRRGFFTRQGKPFLGNIVVGGKTGSLSRRNPYLHYNWFVGFAPAHKPEVAVAVLLGNPAKWRIKAHSAARNLLGQYFKSRHVGSTEKEMRRTEGSVKK